LFTLPFFQNCSRLIGQPKTQENCASDKRGRIGEDFLVADALVACQTVSVSNGNLASTLTSTTDISCPTNGLSKQTEPFTGSLITVQCIIELQKLIDYSIIIDY